MKVLKIILTITLLFPLACVLALIYCAVEMVAFVLDASPNRV